VHRDDQAIVVVGRSERGQRAGDVPSHRADDHGTVGIGGANDRQRVGEQLVPALGGHRVVRLVEQLEPQPTARARVVLGDLRPQRKEASRVAVRVGTELVEVVHVDHHAEVASQRTLDGPVDAIEEAAVDPEGSARAGMRRPPDRQSNRVEAGTAHHVEMPLAQPVATPTVAVQRAAEVDPAA
jgi:hypothetical protein